jgi:hypothetical protein
VKSRNVGHTLVSKFLHINDSEVCDMKHEHEESAFKEARRGVGPILLVAAAVLVVAALLYFGLGGPDDAVVDVTPAVRDTATVVPPVVDNTTTVGQQTPQTAGQQDLAERQLSSPRTTLGAGAAPVTTRENAEDSVVINGELLEGLEAEAQASRE